MADGRAAAMVAMTLKPPHHEATRWTVCVMARAGLPLKKGGGPTITRDQRRSGAVMGQNMQRYRHQGLIRFRNALERDIPAGKIVHSILENYAAPKHAKVRAWLERNPRWTFHFIPTLFVRLTWPHRGYVPS